LSWRQFEPAVSPTVKIHMKGNTLLDDFPLKALVPGNIALFNHVLMLRMVISSTGIQLL
jgi:hypothetical protein